MTAPELAEVERLAEDLESLGVRIAADGLVSLGNEVDAIGVRLGKIARKATG